MSTHIRNSRARVCVCVCMSTPICMTLSELTFKEELASTKQGFLFGLFFLFCCLIGQIKFALANCAYCLPNSTANKYLHLFLIITHIIIILRECLCLLVCVCVHEAWAWRWWCIHTGWHKMFACSSSLPHPVTGPADFQLSIAHTIVIE